MCGTTTFSGDVDGAKAQALSQRVNSGAGRGDVDDERSAAALQRNHD
jgi:hypothetical protein